MYIYFVVFVCIYIYVLRYKVENESINEVESESINAISMLFYDFIYIKTIYYRTYIKS